MLLTTFRLICQAASEEKNFKNRPIRNKYCLCRPYLLMDRNKMSYLNRGPSIDASYPASHHLAERFQRKRLKCNKLTDDGRQAIAKPRITFDKVS